MQEIESLNQTVNHLTGAVDFWNHLMLWGLGIAAVAAAWIGVSTRLVVVRSKQLTVAQDLLASAKDAQLQDDLKSKDIEIGHLQLQTEQERLARVKLELQMMPRRLSGKQMTLLENLLRPKPGTIVIVSALLDGESTDIADDFDVAFNKAGWKTLRYKTRITDKRDVEIGTVVGTDDGGEAKEIGGFLLKSGVTAVTTFFSPDDQTISPRFQKNVLYLVVNHKPETPKIGHEKSNE